MIELSNERIKEILNDETPRKEETDTILRAIYTRYMRLCEEYFTDIDALNNDKIAEWRKYDEETKSLIRYYHMDIPKDVCDELEKYSTEFSDKLLGPDWHTFVFDSYEAFKEENWDMDKSEEKIKEAFSKQVLKEFYELMDKIFREGFGTESKTDHDTMQTISRFMFGKDDKE